MANAMGRAAKARRTQDEIVHIAEAIVRARHSGTSQNFDALGVYANRDWLKDVITDPSSTEETDAPAPDVALPAIGTI